jgi:hypothetical protein
MKKITARRKVLMVQCCSLQQFFFVFEQLRERYPDWSLDALVGGYPEIEYYLDQFPFLERVYRLGSCHKVDSVYDEVVFPLLSRGYYRIKCEAWNVPGRKLSIDYSGKFSRLNRWQLYSSLFFSQDQSSTSFKCFLKDFPYPPIGEKILIVESCHPSLLVETASRLSKQIPETATIFRARSGSLLQNWRRLRAQSLDGAVVYFSSEKGFLGLKLLPFLLRPKKILVFDEYRSQFRVRPRTLARFVFNRLRHGAHYWRRDPRILLLQTEAPEYIAETVQRLRSPDLFPQSQILLACREEDCSRLQKLEGVEQIVSYGKASKLKESFSIWRKTKKFRPDINCAVFTGRPIFRKQKLAYFLLGSRQKLAFNASLDNYWMTFTSWHRVFAKEPLLPELIGETKTDVLVIETAAGSEMLRAIQILQEPHVVPAAGIRVFCRADRRTLFESQAGVDRVVTYSKESLRENLAVIWEILRSRPDVVCAVFSNSRVFRKHKLLFWMVPAGSRLVFNRHLDCFFVDRFSLHYLLDLDRTQFSPLQLLVRLTLRGFLFLPRFAYLLIWRAATKLKRRRVLKSLLQ